MGDRRVGKRFKTRREELGLTQQELAEKLGVGENYISRLECGLVFPRYDKLICLLNLLDISCDAVLRDVVKQSKKYEVSQIDEIIDKLSPEGKAHVLEIIKVVAEETRKFEKSLKN